MRDFRVVQAKTVLKTTSLSPIRGFEPASIVILGEKLDTTSEIFFNGVAVDEFMLFGPTRLVARIPDTQVGLPIREVQVLSNAANSQKDALLSLGIARPTKTVSGIDRLVQQFILELMTTPGSDIFNPNSGGGARTIIGRNANDGRGASAELSLAIDRTKQRILKSQAQLSQIPPSERLLSASLSDVQFDPANTTLSGVVDLRSVAGDSALVTIR